MSGFDVDPGLRAEFIDESMDSLSQVAGLFVQLEADPENLEAVEAIFRPVHSIKGNAAYFELMRIKELSHKMENVLDLVRKKSLFPSKAVTDILLEGLDALTTMLERARAGQAELEDVPAFEELLARVEAAAEEPGESLQALWGQLRDGLEGIGPEGTALLDVLRGLAAQDPVGRKALGLETPPEAGAPEAGADAPSAFVELRRLLATEIATHLPEDQARQVGVLLEELEPLVQGDEARGWVAQARNDYDMFIETIGVDPVFQSMLNEILDKLQQAAPWPAAAAPAAEAPPPEPAEAAAEKSEESRPQGGAAPAANGKTMRVTEASIDGFLAHVGDLVVIGEMYQHFWTRLAALPGGTAMAGELRQVNHAFENLSGALQHSIMDIRKVPLRSVFQRGPRIVRDVASAAGKQIEIEVRGEEISIDKSIVDVLEAPLTHILRNSADHGIEPPERRREAGKPPCGKVELYAVEGKDHVDIVVRDDGKGIDLEAIAAKGRELGMIGAGQSLDEQALIDLLFSSGVSTAEKVTDVSGRGVGMDVAKRNVDSMGGEIQVQTEAGKGSTFLIRMPKAVSTQILQGFSVIVNGERFILPMERIVRCFRPERAALSTVQGRGECVRDGEQVLTVRRFDRLLAMRRERSLTLDEGILIVVESGGLPYAMHVDEIEGVKQVVLKEIDESLNDRQLFLGGAIMGNGTVSMVVDLDRLIECGDSETEARTTGDA